MLKSLIQLFAESFLKNKSEWVGNQSYPKQRIELSTELTEYTPPSDGFLCIYKGQNNQGGFLDAYCRDASNRIITRQSMQFVQGITQYSQAMPVKKGFKVTLVNKNNSSYGELWFAPAEGSQS